MVIGLIVDHDVAGVGLVETVEDRHQCRLASAIFADDAMDRSPPDGEIDILVGMDRPETLVDAPKFDCNVTHVGLFARWYSRP